jgi:release factor glutamine methyltransferase
MSEVVGITMSEMLGHLKYSDYLNVYEPAEDTFLLIDAIVKDKLFLRIKKPKLCVEIGCGTGSVSVVLSKLLKDILVTPPYFVLTEINIKAANIAYSTCVHNGLQHFDIIQTDLLSGIEEYLKGKIDVLVFNPPYVPTPSSEVGKLDISAAWAGGIRGREVIDRLLPKLPYLLSPLGTFYILLVEENDPAEIEKIVVTLGLSSKILLKKQAKNEFQLVMKIYRKN